MRQGGYRMSVRIAVGLSVVAVLVALAAMALAVVALTEDAPASSAPTRDEPGAYTKSGGGRGHTAL